MLQIIITLKVRDTYTIAGSTCVLWYNMETHQKMLPFRFVMIYADDSFAVDAPPHISGLADVIVVLYQDSCCSICDCQTSGDSNGFMLGGYTFLDGTFVAHFPSPNGLKH